LRLAAHILLSLPFWLLRIAVFLPLAALGLVLVAALAWGHVYRVRFSTRFGRDVLRFPWPFWLWNNDEDSIDGLRGGDPAQFWWAEETASYSIARRIWAWAAVRNPVNNLRYVPVLNPTFRPERIRSIGMDHEMQDGEAGWYFAWQGLYSCIRWEFLVPRWIAVAIAVLRWIVILVRHFEMDWRVTWPMYFRLWLGWCLKSEDVKGIAADDTRLPRADFKLQFKRVA
jgi:hypothetical protein